MVDQQAVIGEIWPRVHRLIQAIVAEADQSLQACLIPGRPAALMYQLYGFEVMHILAKTVLGRDQVNLIGATETNNGKNVHIEYAWTESDATEITAAEVVTVTLRSYRRRWQVTDIHPSTLSAPLTEPRAQLMLASLKTRGDGEVPMEPWVLPYLLFSGALQLAQNPEALHDAVEALLLPGLQQRTHGVFSQIMGQKLWRDFRRKSKPHLNKPGCYAAATEFILSELGGRQVTQATTASLYDLSLVDILGPIRQIKSTLNIIPDDSRYAPNSGTRIILN